MLEKIHCDLLDIAGVDWSTLTEDRVRCIATTIHTMPLLGDTEELYGFVGTAQVDTLLGGFFVIQFPTQFVSYTRDKTPTTETTEPAERVFFAILLNSGRLLLQNRRFQLLPIQMAIVKDRFQKAISDALRRCDLHALIVLDPTTTHITKAELQRAYDTSQRVSRLQVRNPDPDLIPADIVYYNPQRQRNRIIRDSRLHDYPKVRQIDLTAKNGRDLRDTHLGQDLIHAATPDHGFLMEYEDQTHQQRILRRLRHPNFEFYIDLGDQQLPADALLQVQVILRREASLDTGLPDDRQNLDGQPRLF